MFPLWPAHNPFGTPGTYLKLWGELQELSTGVRLQQVNEDLQL
jgi:hypothetical protein